MGWFTDPNTACLERIAKALEAIRLECKYTRFVLHKPGLLRITITNEFRRNDMDVISFKIGLPAVNPNDNVRERELSVQVGEGQPEVSALLGDAVESEEYEGEQDATVTASLVDIDEKGNRSEATTLVATLADTFAPAKPGELSITITGERNVVPAE